MEKEGQRRCKKTRAEATSTRTLGGPTASSFLWTQELSRYYSGATVLPLTKESFGETYSF